MCDGEFAAEVLSRASGLLARDDVLSIDIGPGAIIVSCVRRSRRIGQVYPLGALRRLGAEAAARQISRDIEEICPLGRL